MYAVNRASYPALILKCIDQALANPYSQATDMNQAMGYAQYSQSGRHHLALGQLAGCIETTPFSWLRPTQAGRTLLAQSRLHPEALWQVLLALPAYRRYLEYELLRLLLSNHQRNSNLGAQVQRITDEAFPAFQARAIQLRQQLALAGQPGAIILSRLMPRDSLEQIAPAALDDLASAQRLLSGKSDLTRAAGIGRVLAQSASVPLRIDFAWLRGEQALTLLLLAAARQKEQGIIISLGQPTLLAQVVTELQSAGLDIRIEQRGSLQVAALVLPVSLQATDWTTFLRRSHEQDTPDLVQIRKDNETLSTIEEVVWKSIKTRIRVGISGQSRGQIALEELAQIFSQHLTYGLGEFSGHSAADEMQPIPSTLTIGGSLPLASDLSHMGRLYRFFDEAIEAQQRQTVPGVAVLLSLWLLEQQAEPERLLTIHPHLALLYLIAADTGAQAELLKRREERWYLEGKPLILALDDRLRALGYEVWDEGYVGRDEVIHSFGQSLVEQGLRCGVLEHGEAGPASLEAPSSYGYYEASVLLVPATTGGSVR